MKRPIRWAWALLVAVGLQAARGDGVTTNWYDRLSLSGDIRYRVDSVQQEGKANRERDRIRARIGLQAMINEDVDVGIQVGTDEGVNGLGNPNSGNQTLTGEYAKKGFYLDKAYIAIHPKRVVEGLELIGGKMANPLITEGTLLWDPDITPEGAALKYRTGDQVQLLLNGSYQLLQERATDAESRLFVGQAAVNFKPGAGTHILVGGSYYGFQNMQGFGVLDWSGGQNAYNNTTTKSISGTTTNLLYANDYKVMEAFAELGLTVGLPVTVYGSYINNTDPSANSQGYLAGVKFGKLGAPNTFAIGYDYRRLEKDAFPGFLTDDDFNGGGTDAQGHKFYAAYQILKNLEFGVTYFLTRRGLAAGETETDYKHLMVDLIARF